jgi:hypothetical protein
MAGAWWTSDPGAMDRQHMNRDSRRRNANGAFGQASAYIVAAALIVGGILLTSASAGIGWALMLFGTALVIAENDPSKGAAQTTPALSAIVARAER